MRERVCAYGSVSSEGRDNAAGGGVSYFNGAVVVLVGDEYVAVGEKLSGVWIAQLVMTDANHAVLTVLPHYGIVAPLNFNDPLVALVGYEHVSVRQERVLDWSVQLVRAKPGHTEPTVLPDDVAGLVDQENTVVSAAVLAVLCGSGGGAFAPQYR